MIRRKVLGKNLAEIYCEDFTVLDDVLSDCSVHSFMTDPPYGIDVRDNISGGKAKWDLGGDYNRLENEILVPFLKLVKKKLAKDGVVFMFCSQTYISHIEELIINHGFTINNRIVWAYDNGLRRAIYSFPMAWEMIFIFGFDSRTIMRVPRDPNRIQEGVRKKKNLKKDGTISITVTLPNPDGTKYTDVLFVSRLTGTLHERHPHLSQKPLGIMDILVKSIPKGSLVCDPFMGSGTTGVSALRGDMKFIGVEKELEYFKFAYKRLKKETDAIQLKNFFKKTMG